MVSSLNYLKLCLPATFCPFSTELYFYCSISLFISDAVCAFAETECIAAQSLLGGDGSVSAYKCEKTRVDAQGIQHSSETLGNVGEPGSGCPSSPTFQGGKWSLLLVLRKRRPTLSIHSCFSTAYMLRLEPSLQAAGATLSEGCSL